MCLIKIFLKYILIYTENTHHGSLRLYDVMHLIIEMEK